MTTIPYTHMDVTRPSVQTYSFAGSAITEAVTRGQPFDSTEQMISEGVYRKWANGGPTRGLRSLCLFCLAEQLFTSRTGDGPSRIGHLEPVRFRDGVIQPVEFVRVAPLRKPMVFRLIERYDRRE